MAVTLAPPDEGLMKLLVELKRFWSAVAERSADIALEKYERIVGSKAPSPLRSAGALQGALGANFILV